MKFCVCQLDACNYNEIPRHVVLYNVKELTDTLWIRLPRKFSRCFALTQVESILPEQSNLEFEDSITKENIWLKVPTDIIDKSIGQHIYRIWLQREGSTDTYVLYFSYIIQDDNPDKPYIYMK